jgi:hypothetical protein
VTQYGSATVDDAARVVLGYPGPWITAGSELLKLKLLLESQNMNATATTSKP